MQKGVRNLFFVHSDQDRPDSLTMDISSSGRGTGLLAAGSRSMIGIGNTSQLGYVHSVNEETRAGGMFAMNGEVRWRSFTSSI
jgi:hypothetical protein